MLHKLDLTQERLRNSCFLPLLLMPVSGASVLLLCCADAAVCGSVLKWSRLNISTHQNIQQQNVGAFFLISSDLQIQSNFIYTHPSTKSHWCKECGTALWCVFGPRENGWQNRSVLTQLCKPVILAIPDASSGLKQLLLSACMHTQSLQMEVTSAGGLPISGVILTKHDI